MIPSWSLRFFNLLGLVTFQFSQPLQRDGGNGGSVTLEMNREDSTCSNSNLTIDTAGKSGLKVLHDWLRLVKRESVAVRIVLVVALSFARYCSIRVGAEGLSTNRKQGLRENIPGGGKPAQL